MSSTLDSPSVHTRISVPQLSDWEELIRVYTFMLYWKNARNHKMYVQKTVLVSSKSIEILQNEIDKLVEELNELESKDFYYILEELDISDKYGALKYDSSVIAVQRPLIVGRRSKQTGKQYTDPELNFCPHSGRPLQYIITA